MSGIKGAPKPQLAKIVFYKHKNTLKKLLQMGEFKFGGRKSQEYKFFKKNCNEFVYEQLKYILRLFENLHLVERCYCGALLDKREGTTVCQYCAGSGYKNTDNLHDMLALIEGWDDDASKMIVKVINQNPEVKEEFLNKGLLKPILKSQ